MRLRPTFSTSATLVTTEISPGRPRPLTKLDMTLATLKLTTPGSRTKNAGRQSTYFVRTTWIPTNAVGMRASATSTVSSTDRRLTRLTI